MQEPKPIVFFQGGAFLGNRLNIYALFLDIEIQQQVRDLKD